MGRLWQVALGLVLAFVCQTIAQTQTMTVNKCPEEFSCPVEELNAFGDFWMFISWILIVVAAVNLMKCFGRPDK